MEDATAIEPPSLKGLPPIFAECVAEESTRYGIDRPWVRDGVVYATDGRVCVRMRIAGEDAGSGPDTSGLCWASDVYEDNATPLPDIGGMPGPVPCSTCVGDGHYTCTECESDVECPRCDGTGEIDGYEPERITLEHASQSACLLNTYIWKLQRGRVQAVYLRKQPPSDERHSVRFVVGNVEGLLMTAAAP